MNLLSLAAVALMLLAMTATAGLMVFAMGRSLHRPDPRREALIARIRKLPLARMLAARQIDESAYLAHERLIDVHQQINACTGCDIRKRCEPAMSGHGGEQELVALMDACPNADSLTEVKASATRAERNEHLD